MLLSSAICSSSRLNLVGRGLGIAGRELDSMAWLVVAWLDVAFMGMVFVGVAFVGMAFVGGAEILNGGNRRGTLFSKNSTRY